jgi:hypothetical protein
VLGKNIQGEGHHSDHNTNVAGATLVSRSATNVSGPSYSVAINRKHTTVTTTGKTPISGEREPGPSGMEGVRERATSEGLSNHSTDLVLGAWRSGTKVAYNSAWTKWDRWCDQQQVDLFQATVAIVNFLGNMHSDGYEYSTINAH